MASALVRIPDVSSITLTPAEPNALLVTVRDAKGKLAMAGFRNGDLVVGIDGKEFEDTASLMASFAVLMTKDKATFRVLRDGRTFDLEFTTEWMKGGENDIGGAGDETPFLSHQALHALRLCFSHPILEKPMEVTAPLPDYFTRLIALLDQYRKR